MDQNADGIGIHYGAQFILFHDIGKYNSKQEVLYLYTLARVGELQWLHADWPGHGQRPLRSRSDEN
jgi:hypothetical protein